MSDDMANKKPKITFGEAFNESLPYSSDVDSWATRLGVTAVLTALTNQRSDFYNEETLTLIYICLGLFALLSAIPVYMTLIGDLQRSLVSAP